MVQQLQTPPDCENDFSFKISNQVKMSKVDFPFSARAGIQIQIKSHPDLDTLEEMESVIANDICKPIVFALNYMLPFPDRILYNRETRRFVLIRPTLIRKVTCALWAALIMWRLCVKISPNSKETSNGVLSHVVKGSYVLFSIYCVVFFLQLWTSGQTFTSILNQGIDSSSDLVLKFQSAPKTRLVFLVTHASWIFCLTFSFTSHVMGGVIAIANELTGNKNNSSMIMFGYGNMTAEDPYSLNELNPQYSVIVHAVLVLANFLNTFNWMLSFLYIGIWAIAFRQLFTIFFSKMDFMSQYGYELDLPREIRTFNKIAALVDKYNALNGPLLLSAAVASIMYTSSSIEQVITGVKNISQFGLKIHLFLSYVPIFAAAIMISEVNRKANMFSDVIKHYYHQGQGVPTCFRTTEALYGISIVHHDVCMSNIGFKGLGFFTGTYKFLLTMFSVIITYSLVAIQWLATSA